MTKALIAGGMLIFGLLLGNGWRDAAVLVYDAVQQAPVAVVTTE